jgi:hypothetical protein
MTAAQKVCFKYLTGNIWPNNFEVVAAGHEVGVLDVR